MQRRVRGPFNGDDGCIKEGNSRREEIPSILAPLLRLRRLRRFALRGLNGRSFEPQQLILEVVVTSCADVEMDHTSLFSLRLILVEHRAKHRQRKKKRES